MNKKIIIGTTASDCHVVTHTLIIYLLKQLGYEIINLGVQTGAKEFIEEYKKNNNALAIIISSQNGQAYEDLCELPALLKTTPVNCPIILGGNLTMGCQKPINQYEPFYDLGITNIINSIDVLQNFLEQISFAEFSLEFRRLSLLCTQSTHTKIIYNEMVLAA